MTPIGWQAKRFEEIADYQAGRTPSRANPDFWQKVEGSVPWISISDMTEYGTVTSTKETITPSAFSEVFRSKIVPAGTLIMSFKLTIGRISTLGMDACHNEAIIAIYPKPGIDQRYLGFYLSQVDFDDMQDRQIKGNTLNQEKIDRIEILIPEDKDEQKQIADVLEFLRKAIEVQDKSLTAAQDLKRAAMRTLFTRGLRGEAQKETEIGLMPESWVIGTLESSVEHPDYGYTESATNEPIGPKFLRITDIQEGGVNWDTVPYCRYDSSTFSEKKLGAGDIVVARIGATTGKAYLIKEAPEAVFASYMIRLRTNPKKMLPQFLYYYMQGDSYWQHIDQNKGGRLKGGVNIPILLAMPIGRPELDEQAEIVAILDAIDRKIDLHRRKRKVLDELFKSLLHKLMTGEIRVDELDLSALGPVEGATA